MIAWAGTFSGITFLWLKASGLLRIDEAPASLKAQAFALRQDTEAMGIDMKSHSPPKAYAMTSGTGGVGVP